VIHCTRTGSGEPLVLLHALGLDRHMWDPVVERLASEREVYAVDMPGFGASAPIDPAAPADLARAIGDALGLDRPHVAGNSLGGWVALELARAGRARSVTAIAPAGLWTQPLAPKRATAHRAARALRPALPLLLRRGRRLALGGTIAHPERVPYAAALQLVRAYASAPGFDAVNRAMRGNVFDGLAEIDVPLTLAWCEHDRLVARPGTVPAFARELRLRGCGHMPTWDDPGQVARVLLAGSPRDVELAADQDRDAG
jgi:pimeloyl-ACP methyl ester carboxylesterase